MEKSVELFILHESCQTLSGIYIENNLKVLSKKAP